MDYFKISTKGKFRLARWINKRYRELCISELIRNAPDERTLFKMCEYIDSWYDEHEGPVTSKEASGAANTVPETPTPIIEAKQEVPVKHTRLKQHNFSRNVSHRLNVFITNNPEVCISRMLSEATTEDDLMKAMDEVESRKVPVDIRVKMWTVRPSTSL